MKQLSSSTENTTNNNSLFNRNSTVGVEQIFEWLDEQKSAVTPIKNSIIDSLKSSSIFEQMWVEELNEEENLIIVPLSSDFHSQHNAQYGPKNYLLFIEDVDGKIRKGNIIQYLPENGNAFPDLPVSSFHNLYNHEDLEADGKYVFLSMADVFEYDFTYHDGELTQYNYVEQERIDLTCTHWWLVHIDFFADGHTETDITDLGETCSTCPPNQLCDEIDGSQVLVGSNSPSLFPTPATAVEEFIVAEKDDHNTNTTNWEWWRVVYRIRLNGWRFDNSSNNFFSANPVNNGLNAALNLSSGINFGPCGLPSGDCFAQWDLLTFNSSRSNNNKTANVYIQGTISFPNRGDGTPTSLYGNYINFLANATFP